MFFKTDNRTNYAKLLDAYKQGKVDVWYICSSVDVFITPSQWRKLIYEIKKYNKKKGLDIDDLTLLNRSRKEIK